MSHTNGVQADSCPVQKIPLEVLLRISYLLRTTELGNLRLTCRSLEQSLYPTFVREFFTTKKFMISDHSLQALIDISRSRLSQHLCYVQIGLDRFPESLHRPLPDDDKECKFREKYSNNFTLWNTGYHRDMLAEAFRNLPNLQDVIIRDCNSRRRTRDGFDTEWRSYGVTTVFNETGISLNQSMEGIWNSGFPLQYCSQVFAAVVYALGIANATPTGIEIISRHGNHLRDFAFNIPTFMEPSVLPMLHKLEKLHLCIDLDWRNSRPNVGGSPLPGNRGGPDLSIRKFLANTPNLKDLRINERRSNSFGLPALLDWLATDPTQAPSANKSVAGVNAPNLKQQTVFASMPHLENLSLGHMNLDAPRLLELISRFAPSLKGFEMFKVTLVRNLPSHHLNDPAPREVFLTSLLKNLMQVPRLDLRHVKLSMLQQQWIENPVPAHVSFKNVGPTVQYTGPDWKHFLTEIMSLVEVQWPYEANGGDDSDDSSEVEEEDAILDGLSLEWMADFGDESLPDPAELLIQELLDHTQNSQNYPIW